ncbi:hypothetical protein [Mycolicibacterium sp. P9-64]|uniref:hypothetical protein n=1 Tax=Mycolicibacterium sp. P9-64 TaxID=2024612 RepID=UPI001F5B5824|nr:hypothetical protein [Mycolicibacterium sp. P9-64]
MTTPMSRQTMNRAELDAIAWKFLRSEFASRVHADWPIDRRVVAYLRHHGPSRVLRDGTYADELLQRVMANIGSARRTGVLSRSAR